MHQCSSFSSRFSWCRHTSDAYVATTRIYATLFVSRRWNFLAENRTFFFFFFLFLSNHVLAKKIDDRIPRTMDDPRNINLSTNLLFSKRSIYTSLRVYRRLRSKYFRTIFQILGNSFPNIYTSILFFATRFNTGVGTVRCTFVLG